MQKSGGLTDVQIDRLMDRQTDDGEVTHMCQPAYADNKVSHIRRRVSSCVHLSTIHKLKRPTSEIKKEITSGK